MGIVQNCNMKLSYTRFSHAQSHIWQESLCIYISVFLKIYMDTGITAILLKIPSQSFRIVEPKTTWYDLANQGHYRWTTIAWWCWYRLAGTYGNGDRIRNLRLGRQRLRHRLRDECFLATKVKSERQRLKAPIHYQTLSYDRLWRHHRTVCCVWRPWSTNRFSRSD